MRLNLDNLERTKRSGNNDIGDLNPQIIIGMTTPNYGIKGFLQDLRKFDTTP